MSPPSVTLTSATHEQTPRLSVARYRVYLRAEAPIRLPAYAGSAWRGVLGHALKRTVCVTREPSCPGCLLYRSCVYPYVFETPPPTDTAKLRKYPAAPHPFVVEPLAGLPGCGGRCRPLGVDLTLLGRGRTQLPYFIEALRRAGETGIGKERNGCLCAGVRGSGNGRRGWTPIYAPGGRWKPCDTDHRRCLPCPRTPCSRASHAAAPEGPAVTWSRPTGCGFGISSRTCCGGCRC